jgi:hypothetical protein
MNQLRHAIRRRLPGRTRRGLITLELLLNLPVWFIMFLAIMEFGTVFSDAQQVTLAGRVGAQAAAHCVALPTNGEVPQEIVDAVHRTLAAAGLRCTRVIVEHNVCGKPAILASGPGNGVPPAYPSPRIGSYVRVTVYARPSGTVSGLFARAGLDWSKRILSQTTTWPYQVKKD